MVKERVAQFKWEFSHLAHQSLAHKDVPGCQVPVHEMLLGQVLHAAGNLATEGEEGLWARRGHTNGPEGW